MGFTSAEGHKLESFSELEIISNQLYSKVMRILSHPGSYYMYTEISVKWSYSVCPWKAFKIGSSALVGTAWTHQQILHNVIVQKDTIRSSLDFLQMYKI